MTLCRVHGTDQGEGTESLKGHLTWAVTSKGKLWPVKLKKGTLSEATPVTHRELASLERVTVQAQALVPV